MEYAVRAEPQGTTVQLGQATWADWDQRGRLVIAQGGRLRTALPGDPIRELQEVADLYGQTPDPCPAPDWARSWPAAGAHRR